MTTTELQLYVVRLQNLVYRMALMIDDYHLDEVDVEGKGLLQEANAIANEMVPASDVPRRQKPDLRVVS
jgi:hypothetical protein